MDECFTLFSNNKLRFWFLICVCCGISTALTAQRVNFDYAGPDTIEVGANCTGILDWGHPDNPQITANIPGLVIINISYTISGGYQIGDAVPGGTSVTVQYLVTDNMGGSSTFQFSIAFADRTPPVFDVALMPPSITLACGDPGDIPAGGVTDNCTARADLIITYVDSAPLDFCTALDVTRVWTVTDASGNSATYTQVLQPEQDVVAPVLVSPAADITADCNVQDIYSAFSQWLNNHGSAVVSDDCSSLNWTTSPANPALQGNCGTPIVVTFTASDACGRSVSTTASFTYTDTEAPVFGRTPQRLIHTCNGADIEQLLESWLLAGANAEISDACTPGDSLSLSYEVFGEAVTLEEVLERFGESVAEGCKNNILIGGNAYDNVLGFVIVNFVFTDLCGNRLEGQSTFAAIDTAIPQWTTNPQSLVLDCGAQEDMETALTDWYTQAGGAIATDDCGIVFIQATPGLPEVLNAFRSSQSAGCGRSGSVSVAFALSDACGNAHPDTLTAVFTVQDTTAPVLTVPASDLTVYCGGSLDQDIYDAIDRYLGADASDACGLVSWDSLQWEDSNGLSGMAVLGQPDQYPLPGSQDCSWSVQLRFFLSDECGNITQTSAELEVRDTSAPVFVAFPADVTVSCHEVPPATEPMVTDLCRFNLRITLDETTTQVPDPTLCGHYTYTIVRHWTAADACGNTATQQQTITVIDTTGPVFSLAPNRNISCDGDLEPDMAHVRSRINDNCDDDPVITYRDIEIIGRCRGEYRIERQWEATDRCGNKTAFVEQLFIIDTSGPLLTVAPSDLTVSCGAEVSLDDIFADWVSTLGGATATDNCSSVSSFAAVPGSYNPGNPATFPGTLPTDPGIPACGGAFALETVVDFVFYDECGNVTVRQARLLVIDDQPPVIEHCADEQVLVADPGMCEGDVTAQGPIASDACLSTVTADSVSAGAPLVSAEPGNLEVPVDPVILELPLTLDPDEAIVAPVSLSVRLLQADAESATEYLIIYDEDGRRLGQTSPVSMQCGDGVTLLTNLQGADINRWAADGVVRFRIEPNIPAGQSGRFAVNDICPGARIDLTLHFHRSISSSLQYQYSLNGGPVEELTDRTWNAVLPVGTHDVVYFVTDCFGNQSSCHQTIRLEDREPPVILCPSPISVDLTPGSCEAMLDLPLPSSYVDNCGFPEVYLQTLPSDTAQAMLTFARDPDLGGFIAEDREVSFSGVNNNASGSPVRLEVMVQGNVDEPGAYFSIRTEEGSLLGTTEIGQSHVTDGDCTQALTAVFDIPAADFNRWAADGVVRFTAVSNTNFSIPPGGPESGINPCDLTAVISDGDTDGSSFLFMRLAFNSFQAAYSIEGATEVPLTELAGPDRRPRILFQAGNSTVRFQVADPSGNIGSCTFGVELNDPELPVARCTNALIHVLPSVTEPYNLSYQEIDGGSTDNCRIEDYFLVPSTFTCAQVGQEPVVTLTVTDVSGNTASCTAIVRIEGYILQPAYSLEVCEDDTLQLFANLPAGSGGNLYTYSWTGPNGFVSNLENPAIPNVTTGYSGTYTLVVTGAGGCTATGSVSIQIPQQLGTPDLLFEKNPVCEGDDIVLETQAFTGNVKYKWYRGVAPGGVLVEETPAPLLRLTMPPGTYQFYVVVESPSCVSNPSAARQVSVLSRITATVVNDYIEVCEGTPLQLGTTQVGPNLKYEWTGPGQFRDTVAAPLVTTATEPVMAGVYTLFIYESGCPSHPATVEVVVKPKPATPILVFNGIRCPGEELVLTVNNVPDADVYRWVHPDGSTIHTITNSLIIPAADDQLNGQWRVRLIVDDCLSEFSSPVLIDIEESYTVSATNSGPVCEGDSVELTVPLFAGATYEWLSPGGQLVSGSAQARVPALPGVYSARVTTAAGCVYQSNTQVIVYVRPTVTALSTDAAACVKDEDLICFQATVFPADNGTYIYSWSGPSFASSLREPCLQGGGSSRNGDYVLTVRNSDGCVSRPQTIRLQVKDVPDTPELRLEDFYCEGQDLLIRCDDYGAGAIYTWTSPIGSQVSQNPFLLIAAAGTIHNGNYQVAVEVDGCISDISAAESIQLRQAPARPVVTADPIVCEGDTLFLRTDFVPGASYQWEGPGWSGSADQNPFIYPAFTANTGNYTLRIIVNGCPSPQAQPFYVQVNSQPATPGIESSVAALCASLDGAALQLCIQSPDVVAGTSYSWYLASDGRLIAGPTNARCVTVQDFSQFADGINEFYVIASKDGCRSVATVPLAIRIDKVPAETADAGPDLIACDQDEIRLNAGALALSQGQWTAIRPSTAFEDPADPRTTVFGLSPGENTLIWALSYRSCVRYSADTLSVTYQTAPQAADDAANVPFAGVALLDLLANDQRPFAYTLDIIQPPMHGVLISRLDGAFDFRAEPNYVGPDSLIYRICATGCPELCATAVARLLIGDDSDCDIPTIITPNNDGINDVFFIPCLESDRYPGNKVSIFNEWGTAVFEESPYSNTWQGRYKEAELPVGTYFYILDFANGQKPKKGFLIIKR